MMSRAVMMFAAVAAAATVALAEETVPQSREPNTAAARAELYRLINQVRTMKFADQPGEKQAGGKHEAAAEPNSTKPAAQNEAKPAPVKTEAQAQPAKEATPIVQDPNAMTNPFELAESLYRVGRYKEAAACYRVALARAEADKKHKTSESDLSWMQFQVGNCFVKTDPAEAAKAYRKLITDYPSSEWTPIAIGREQIIQWYSTTQTAAKTERAPVEKQQ
jgi:tetratricopeptide (TPR) repeat protein